MTVQLFQDDVQEEGHLPDANDFIWDEDALAATNYRALGERLAQSGDLYRNSPHGGGLIHLLPDGKHVNIQKGSDLLPVIIDRVALRVVKDGKIKGGKIDAAHLNAMLKSECFLTQFQPVDTISTAPMYQPDFMLTEPGYNDGGVGDRVLFVGGKPNIADNTETINAFLDVMAFETTADRTNAVAAALTVTLRNHFPGGKSIILATATKSHAGKDTIISFATGVNKSTSVSYQATNWALERSIVGALKQTPETAVLVLENARLDHRDRQIASAIVERLATDPEPFLFSTGTGTPTRRRNDIVLAISTNFGSVCEDILNRALPIHLHPVGNVADRDCPIGNPKLEFLPANKEQIAAELRGMIERWKSEGMPLDHDVRHPFSTWAQTVGGILKVNGFQDFLANYGARKTADDPLRHAIGLLGITHLEQWEEPAYWATKAADVGLTRTLIPIGDRDSDQGRKRGIGATLSRHQAETFGVETDTATLTLRLEKARRRFVTGQEASVRYRFVVLESQPIPSEGDSA